MDSLQLVQYRNYEDTTFPLGLITIFLGPNGSGKTSVIEALRTLSVTKSHRAFQDGETIRWGATFCRLVLKLQGAEIEYFFNQEGEEGKKVIKHNGLSLPLTQAYGLIPSVIFSPEVINLINDPPQARRRFLDTLASQADPDYLRILLRYKKILRQRHFILLRLAAGLGHEDELAWWDRELGQSGEEIIGARRRLLNALNEKIAAIYPTFLPQEAKETLVVTYEPSCPEGELTKRIVSQRATDIKMATTTRGPHRDDLRFILGGRDAALVASRGEARRIVLATKLAEAAYIKERKGQPPILLLDDIFSEFDPFRRGQIPKLLTDYQVFITTTEESAIAPEYLASAICHRLPLPVGMGGKK